MEASGDNWKFNYTKNGLTANIVDLLKDVSGWGKPMCK
jgi:hypothetical protein